MSNLVGARLLVATGNAGKLDEFRSLLGPYDVKISSLTDLGLGEPEETEVDFRGNALIKARAGAKGSGMVTLADDSGLEIPRLGGLPGIYTADWAETGSGRDFAHAMTKTWALLQALNDEGPKTAVFRCTLAVVWPDGRELVFEGSLAGQIVWPMRGTQGHGYDPIFRPDGYDVTLGEMEPPLKNRISHRADAFRKLIIGCFT